MRLVFEVICFVAITLVALMVILQIILMAFRTVKILVTSGKRKGGKHKLRAETEESIRQR